MNFSSVKVLPSSTPLMYAIPRESVTNEPSMVSVFGSVPPDSDVFKASSGCEKRPFVNPSNIFLPSAVLDTNTTDTYGASVSCPTDAIPSSSRVIPKSSHKHHFYKGQTRLMMLLTRQHL